MTWGCAERQIDLCRLDADAVDLHLEVDAPEDLQGAVGPVQPAVARPVEPLAGARVQKAARLGLLLVAEVSQGHAEARAPDLAVIAHHGLRNLIRWYRRTYRLLPGDRMTQLGSPSFDLSVLEIWPCLAAGATWYFPDDATRVDTKQLIRWLADTQISVAFLPAPLAEAALAERWPAGTSLRCLNTGGDRLRRRPPPGLPFDVYNHYGPTQASVVTSSALVEPGSDDRPPSIGVPIANTQVYILDEHGRLAPIGAPGELYIGGAGVALGYLRSKDLTRERFVESPAVPGARLYRSGDRVRFRPDGRLRNCLDVRRSPSAAAFAPDGGKADRGDIAAEIAALDPEDVWALAERAAPARRVRLSWARADDRGRFDVIIEAPGHPIAAPAPDLWGLSLEQLTNSPLDAHVLSRHEARIRADLQQRLPRYMLPMIAMGVRLPDFDIVLIAASRGSPRARGPGGTWRGPARASRATARRVQTC